MAEEEIDEGGITVGQVFRTIFSQKWLALIIAAAITVIGTLGLYFIGKGKEFYSVSFVLQLPNTGDASSTSYTYPDGESFYYTDLISAENLKVVASKEGLKSIDVDEMVKDGDISIVRTVDRVDDESQDGVYDLNYTIKVKAKYFEDEDMAREFIEALTAFPRKHISSMNIDYDQSLTTSKSAITYDEQLNLLKNQTAYIQAKYNELIGAHGGEFVVDSGKTLAQCRDEIDAYLVQDLFTALSRCAEENGFVKANTEAKLKYESDKYAKELALERAESALRKLTDLLKDGTGSIIHDEIIALSKEIALLKQEIEILQRYIDSFEVTGRIAPADFEADVAKVETTVTAFTNGIKPVASYVYGRVTKINYLNTKIVELEGGHGIVMSAVISLIVGLIIAAIVAYIVGWNKQRKENQAKGTIPIYGEAQLQAAIAEDESLKDDKGDK